MPEPRPLLKHLTDKEIREIAEDEIPYALEYLKGASYDARDSAFAELIRFARAVIAAAAPASAVVPVAVAERPWEREGWCDEQVYCWFFYQRFNTWSCERPPVALTRGVGRFLSLPHHAIPLPQAGEGQP